MTGAGLRPAVRAAVGRAISLGTLGILTAFVASGEAAPRRSAAASQPRRAYDTSVIESGDVVFRRGRSVVSQMVVAAQQQLPFSHVGIAVVSEQGVMVVHATPDGPPPGLVVSDRIDEFLDADAASVAAVYRVDDSAKARGASEAASRYANVPVPFDAAFDLRTADQLYCTELVWRAYLAVGVDLSGGVREDLAIPLGHGPYLLPDTLLKGRQLRPVVAFASQRIP